MTPELTEDQIAGAMARADTVPSRPSDARCWLFPYDVAGALSTRTPKGRVKIGWIAAEAGRKARDVWLDLDTGEGRLRHGVD